LEVDKTGGFHYFHPRCYAEFKAGKCYKCGCAGELALVPVHSMYLIVRMHLVCKGCFDKITDGTPWESVARFDFPLPSDEKPGGKWR
jgi:hypothetical protein